MGTLIIVHACPSWTQVELVRLPLVKRIGRSARRGSAAGSRCALPAHAAVMARYGRRCPLPRPHRPQASQSDSLDSPKQQQQGEAADVAPLDTSTKKKFSLPDLPDYAKRPSYKDKAPGLLVSRTLA